MDRPFIIRDIPFCGPGRYRITVRGNLSETFSDRLAGMSIASLEGENHRPVTTLVGRLRDQAELNGVLNTLYDLHLTLIMVESLDETTPPSDGG